MQIKPPTNCPSCDGELEWVKDQLYCYNKECPAQSFKQIEHFAKSLKIKGLGPSTIEKLGITHPSDLYILLKSDDVVRLLGSEKVASKVFEEISNSLKAPLNMLLPAFGIPLIGQSATEKLASVVNNFFEIDADSCKKAGLGPKATENLLDWIERRYPEYEDVHFNLEFSKNTKSEGTAGIVCITGKLKSYPTKAAATAFLEGLGYTVKETITKDVTILVNESGKETAKTIKAANAGVRIITNLNDLKDLNGE